MKYIIACFLLPYQCFATCDVALQACVNYADAQSAEISLLKQQNSKLMDELATATKEPILPTYTLIPLSILTGAIAAAILIKK